MLGRIQKLLSLAEFRWSHTCLHTVAKAYRVEEVAPGLAHVGDVAHVGHQGLSHRRQEKPHKSQDRRAPVGCAPEKSGGIGGAHGNEHTLGNLGHVSHIPHTPTAGFPVVASPHVPKPWVFCKFSILFSPLAFRILHLYELSLHYAAWLCVKPKFFYFSQRIHAERCRLVWMLTKEFLAGSIWILRVFI